jgi:hypothetical protein
MGGAQSCQVIELVGVLAVWSSGPAPSFARRLRKAGFLVDEVIVRANAARGGARAIFAGARPSADRDDRIRYRLWRQRKDAACLLTRIQSNPSVYSQCGERARGDLIPQLERRARCAILLD